jgi:hypothetical protein
LLCDLLRSFPGWEAIKTTRGHYRSCGRDPQACCVSNLLEDEAVIRSGRELTYAAGKDTGRYWESGAANVHWVIATDNQVGAGITKAVDRVQSPGVFVEGNSFTKFIEPDCFVMVVRPDDLKIKTTARKALGHVSAFYVSGEAEDAEKATLRAFLGQSNLDAIVNELPILTRLELSQIVALIQAAETRTASRQRATSSSADAS